MSTSDYVCYTYDMFSYMLYLCYVFISVMLMICIHITYLLKSNLYHKLLPDSLYMNDTTLNIIFMIKTVKVAIKSAISKKTKF